MDNMQEGFSDDDIKQKFAELYQVLGEKLKYKEDELCEIYKELLKHEYTINGFIGSGAEGPVFAAMNNSNQIAVKVLSAEDASKIDNQLKIMERFRDQSFIHQFLKAFYSENGKYFFYITEKLTCDLEHIMLALKQKNSTFSYTQIIAFAIQMATALSILEKSKVIHSDLKPANILYDKQNKCFKISDYGFAKIIQQKSRQMRTATQNVIGCTAKYAAPEVLQQSQDYSCKVDIYSLGLILLELIHGSELNLLQVMQILGGGAANIQGYLNEEKQYIQLNKIIQSMLVLDRNTRISATELLEELNSLQNKEETTLSRYLQTRVDGLTLQNIKQLYSTTFSQINIFYIKDTTRQIEWHKVPSSIEGNQSLKKVTFTRARHLQVSQSQSQPSNQLNNNLSKSVQFLNNSIKSNQLQLYKKSLQDNQLIQPSNQNFMNPVYSQTPNQQLVIQNRQQKQQMQQTTQLNKEIIQPRSRQYKKLKFKNTISTIQQFNEIEEQLAKYQNDKNESLDVILQFHGYFSGDTGLKKEPGSSVFAQKLASSLEKCSKSITNLTLKLSYLSLGPQEIKNISQSMGMMCQNLTSLNLKIVDKIGHDGVLSLSEAIEKCSSNLIAVSLNLVFDCSEIGSDAMRSIFQSIEKCENMTTLRLYLTDRGYQDYENEEKERSYYKNNQIEKNAGLLSVFYLASCLPLCQSLTELTLSLYFYGIKNEGFQSLSLSLEKCEKLERLNIQIFEYDIDEESTFEEFGSSIASCPKLSELNLVLYQRTDNYMLQFDSLIPKLSLCTKLVSLSLTLEVQHTNTVQIFQANLRECQHLQSLCLILVSWTLNNTISLFKELEIKNLNVLKLIHYEDFYLDKQKLIEQQQEQLANCFGESLSKFKNLTSLHLFFSFSKYNHFQFIITLLSCISKTIITLSLGIMQSQVRICSSDVKVIGESLEKCKQFKELNLYLWKSEMKQAGAISISQRLQKCPNLTSLKLSIIEYCCNDYQHDHVHEIEQVTPIITNNLKRCKNLQKIQVKIRTIKDDDNFNLSKILCKLGVLTRSESEYWAEPLPIIEQI